MYVCTCRIITELLQNDMSSMLWSLKDNQVPKIHQKLVSRLLKQLDISETTTIILQYIEIDCGIDIMAYKANMSSYFMKQLETYTVDFKNLQPYLKY